MHYRHFYVCCLLTVLLAVILAGCGGGIDTNAPRREVPGISSSASPITAPTGSASASEIDYQGWRAIRLTNGMITVVVVPALGGRIMEYKLGGHPFIWVNTDEAGKTYPAARTEQERAYHNFGGYKLWPTSDRWQGPPDPLGSVLDSGAWEGKIITASGRNVEVEVCSPEDTVTGLQITRLIKLFGGSSQVRVTERITNTSQAIHEYSFRRLTQVPATVESGASFSEKARIYIPTSADSTENSGFVTLEQGGGGQFKRLTHGVLQVSPQGQRGKIGVAASTGWIASVDETHEYAMIQRFEISKAAQYAEQGSTVTIETVSDRSYVEIGLPTPQQNLQPGESVEFTTDWFATRLSGPVLSTNDVAAVQQPVKLERAEGKLKLTGTLGVFAPGTLVIIQQNEAGAPISQPVTIKASPADVVKLNQTLIADNAAKTLIVELQNAAGTPLGEIAKLGVNMPSSTASVK